MTRPKAGARRNDHKASNQWMPICIIVCLVVAAVFVLQQYGAKPGTEAELNGRTSRALEESSAPASTSSGGGLAHSVTAVPVERVDAATSTTKSLKLSIVATDCETDAAIAGMQVWVGTPEGHSRRVVTNEAGLISLQVEPGAYYINAVGSGISGNAHVAVSTEDVESRLRVKRLAWRLAGRVVDEERRPVSSAQVTLVEIAPPMKCKLDANAEFQAQINGADPGVEVSVVARGYVSKTETVMRSDNAECCIVLSHAVSIVVKVVDQYGQPVAGCSVSPRGASADMFVTGPEGKVTLDCLDRNVGSIVAKCSCLGYETRMENLRPDAGGPTKVVLQRCSVLTVIVSDADGKRVPGVSLQLMGPKRNAVWSARTDKGGEAQLFAVEGTYELFAVDQWCLTEPHPVVMASSPGTISVCVRQCSLLHGRIVSDQDGIPVVGAVVEAQRSDGERITAVRSRFDGQYQMYVPDKALGILIIAAKGYLEQTIVIKDPLSAEEIRLKREEGQLASYLSGVISGVEDRGWLRVRLLGGTDYCWPFGATGGDGVVLGLLAGGKWRIDGLDVEGGTRLVLAFSAQGTAERYVEMKAGEALPDPIALPNGVSLTCQVSGVLRDIVQSVRVWGYLMDGRAVLCQSVVVDENGRMDLGRLAAGDRVKMEFLDHKGRHAGERVITVSGDPRIVVFE